MLSLCCMAKDLGLAVLPQEQMVRNITIDSRNVQAGDMFVAICGGRRDGHEFCAQAVSAGATALLVSREMSLPGVAVMKVADTRVALGLLAAAHRQRHRIPVLAITGSNGKTTSKNMCAALLVAHGGAKSVLSTEGNFNNELGMPLTLLRLSQDHRYAVLEMGSSGFGEIARLAHIARPTLGLVTNAQRAHLQNLQSLSQVALEKGSLFKALPSDGVALVNHDDAYYSLWNSLAPQRQISFGFSRDAQVTASYKFQGLQSLISVRLPAVPENVEVRLPLPGKHNVHNALGAMAFGWAMGISPQIMASALEQMQPLPGRLQPKAGLAASLVLDDTYNANPDSVTQAIDVLAAFPRQRILVLGDMGEIGQSAAQWHSEVGGYARSSGVANLLTLGEISRLAAENFGAGGQHFEDVEDLLRVLRPLLNSDTIVLVKGSRFMAMERVVAAIADPHTDRGAPHAL